MFTVSNSQYGSRNKCHALIDLHEQLKKWIDNKLFKISVLAS